MTTQSAISDLVLPRWRVGFALAGGAIAWLAHLLLAYAIAEFGCVAGWGAFGFLGVTAVAWLLIGVSVPLLATAALAGLVSWRLQQRLPGPRGADVPEDSPGAGQFAAYFGIITNVLFTAIILVESIPILFHLQHC